MKISLHHKHLFVPNRLNDLKLDFDIPEGFTPLLSSLSSNVDILTIQGTSPILCYASSVAYS